MKNKNTISKISTLAAVVITLLLAFKPAEVSASHFKGGIVSWSPVGPDSARFVIYASFTRTSFAGSGGDGFAVTGDMFSETIGFTGLDFGDATSTGTLTFEVISYDLGNNLINAIALDPNDLSKQSVDHQYASSGPFTASAATCCRSFGELNNSGKGYDLSTLVEFTSGNSSPFSLLPALFNPILLPPSATASFFVSASDPDVGAELRFRLATPTEAGDVAFVQPAGLTIDNLTGEVSWDNSAVPFGFYSIQVVVEDSDVVNETLLTSIDVDFLIHVCDGFTDGDGDGFSSCTGDCDDGDAAIYPGATEICDLVDNDCDGFVDEGFDNDFDGFTTCEGDCDDALWTYQDDDGDGYGTPVLVPCGNVTIGGDCDDTDPLIHPLAIEVCGNGIDENCDGNELCPGPNDLCGDAISMACGDVLVGTTTGATDDITDACFLTSYNAVWYKWTGDGSDATVSLCGGPASYDPFLEVFTGTCLGGFACVGSNDDFCFLRSQVTFTSTPGVEYFFVVSPLGGGSGGDFTISLTCVGGCDLGAEAEATSDYNGYDVQCYGGSNGEATAEGKLGTPPYTYEWSDGQTTNPATGLAAGTYQVTITDDNGCTASAEVTLNEPTQMTIDAGDNQLVYYGYPDSACATLVAEGAGGGVPPYTYEWSDGSPLHTTNACPATSTVYYVTLTDQNGCTVVDSVKVCAIDVRCGHKLDKVTICHQTGSISNPTNTLCVALNGAKTHIQTHPGDQLAACGTLKVCSFTPPSAKTDEEVSYFLEKEMYEGKTWLGAIPNPFADNTAIRFIVPQDDRVNVRVLDVTGKVVANLFEGNVTFGTVNQASFDGSRYSNGVYFLTLTNSKGERFVEKLVLTR